MADELKTIGMAVRVEVLDADGAAVHWSEWRIGRISEWGGAHQQAALVLKDDAEAIIAELRAELRAEREAPRARAEARVAARERRRAVQWLHERADRMNDEHARAVLHSAATNLGWHNAREKGPAAAFPFQTEEAKER